MRPSNAEHPLTGFLASVASGGRPSDADYNEIVARCVDGQSEMTAAELRRELVSTVRDVLAQHASGNSGEARAIARRSVSVLAETLGELPPPPNKWADKTAAEIVADIPRFGSIPRS